MNTQVIELVKTLKIASNDYYNIGESNLTDSEYDLLEISLRKLDPTNLYFTKTGSDVRIGKVTLPFPMGGLNQLKGEEVTNWIKSNNLLDEEFVISNKMDGVSCCLIYEESKLKIAYSRGNGIQGQDVTRHVKKMNLPVEASNIPDMAIRAEIEIADDAFKDFIKEAIEKKYKVYKNPRNAVAGIMNAKTVPDWIYKYISVICYEVIDQSLSKIEQFEILFHSYFTIVGYGSCLGKDIDVDKLEEQIKININNDSFAQDGLVLELNDLIVRSKFPSKENELAPGYAKKFKLMIDDNILEADVIDVKWAVSKNGLLKPRVEIEPVDIQGITITYATGFNAKFIIDNRIASGANITITRSGDVIPHILYTNKGSDNLILPCIKDFGEYGWDKNKVNFKVLDLDNDNGVFLKRAESFFISIDAPLLKIKSLEKLINRGCNTLEDIINLTESDLEEVLGINGNKAYTALDKILKNILEYKLAGATYFFSEGIGVRKLKKIYEHYGCIRDLSYDQVLEVEGFEEISTLKFIEGLPRYEEFLSNIDDNKIVFAIEDKPESNELSDTVWVFTGIRAKDAEEIIISKGGKIGSGVNKKTTHLVTKDVNSTSSKIKKARDLGIKILSLDEMNKIINE